MSCFAIGEFARQGVVATRQARARWIVPTATALRVMPRDMTLEWSPDPDERVTELQERVYRSGG